MKNLNVLTIAFLLFLGYTLNAQVSVTTDGSAADASAMLDVKSTTGGVLYPRMTTAERNTIASPANSLMIFNTTTRCLEIYNTFTSSWESVHCQECPISAPVFGTHIASQTQIVWNWNTVSGAEGYKYNTVNNYATATDNGISITWTQTGLTCNTSYVLYVWAYNFCGYSSPTTLVQNTHNCYTFVNYTPGFGTPSLLTNGVYAPEQHVWNDPVYAVQFNNSSCYIAWDLGALTNITRIKVQADCNDIYVIQYSTDLYSWTTLWTLPTTTFGLETRTNPSVNVNARYLKISVSGGDGSYSASEVQINY